MGILEGSRRSLQTATRPKKIRGAQNMIVTPRAINAIAIFAAYLFLATRKKCTVNLAQVAKLEGAKWGRGARGTHGTALLRKPQCTSARAAYPLYKVISGGTAAGSRLCVCVCARVCVFCWSFCFSPVWHARIGHAFMFSQKAPIPIVRAIVVSSYCLSGDFFRQQSHWHCITEIHGSMRS